MFTTLFDDFQITTGRKNLLYGVLLLMVEWLQRDKQHVLQFPNTGLFKFVLVRYAIYAAIIYTMFVYSGEVQTFIYFQF